ncbi:hypothetical protein BHM03_00002811 [Ensete ventricosum]|nr:hypothetical protein BHM03_00002811 [Ensete ventricosum]
MLGLGRAPRRHLIEARRLALKRGLPVDANCGWRDRARTGREIEMKVRGKRGILTGAGDDAAAFCNSGDMAYPGPFHEGRPTATVEPVGHPQVSLDHDFGEGCRFVPPSEKHGKA